MSHQDNIDQCLEDLKSTCKKRYVFGGPVTSPSGKKKCIQDLKEKGVFGRDKSPACKDDPEQCVHKGCADASERGELGDLMAEAAPEMKTLSGEMKSELVALKDQAQTMLNKGKGGRTKKRKKTIKRRKTMRKKRKGLRPIVINPKMKGNFTKKAKKANMSVQKYAQYIIKKYKGKPKTKKQLKLLREAVFARNAKTKFNH